MNHTDYIIDNIKRAIQPEILERGFRVRALVTELRSSISYEIKNTILFGWILRDMNLVAGVETSIDLSSSTFTETEDGIIVKISLGHTSGKQITSALSINYGLSSSTGRTSLSTVLAGTEAVSTSRIQLIGPNTIFIEGRLVLSNVHLKCMLENEKDFTGIAPRAIPVIGEMAVVATKAHLYNTLSIPLSRGEIIGGVDISKFGEIIDGWSDSREIYNEMLQNWPKINLMSDSKSHNKLIRALMPR